MLMLQNRFSEWGRQLLDNIAVSMQHNRDLEERVITQVNAEFARLSSQMAKSLELALGGVRQRAANSLNGSLHASPQRPSHVASYSSPKQPQPQPQPQSPPQPPPQPQPPLRPTAADAQSVHDVVSELQEKLEKKRSKLEQLQMLTTSGIIATDDSFSALSGNGSEELELQRSRYPATPSVVLPPPSRLFARAGPPASSPNLVPPRIQEQRSLFSQLSGAGPTPLLRSVPMQKHHPPEAAVANADAVSVPNSRIEPPVPPSMNEFSKLQERYDCHRALYDQAVTAAATSRDARRGFGRINKF